MQRIDINEAPAKLEQLIEKLDHDTVLITRDGHAVAVLAKPGRNADSIGALKDEIEIKGDIMSTGVQWEANSP